MSRDRTVRTTLLNMCMVYDEKSNQVLVQDKVKSSSNDWSGYTFPGGHVENDESLIDSIMREVKEETGLEIRNVKPCGLIDWYCTNSPERWMVFLYKTSEFSGEMLEKTEEGSVFWMKLEEFRKSKLAPGMETYLKLFLSEDVNEAYATWNDTTLSEFKLL